MTSKGPSRRFHPTGIKLTDDEREAIEAGPRPPFLITPHWLGLLDGSIDDPLRRQAVPTMAEHKTGGSELNDPLGEGEHSPLPRLIRRYTDRALVVMTGRCALYCRHCFRRRLTGDEFGDITDKQAADIARYLAVNTDIKELLLSGGDPLTLPDRRLMSLMDTFRTPRPDIVFRLATRIPLVQPTRVTAALARRLGRRRPLWTVIQANHPRELSSEALRAIDRLQSRGIPVINQSVLLKGVNDQVGILEELSRTLVSAGVKPYYLFQGDQAVGTAHFRLPLDEARKLTEDLRIRLSGLAMPNFTVDLPGGGGKVPLGRDYVRGYDQNGWRLQTPDGLQGYYQDPKENS